MSENDQQPQIPSKQTSSVPLKKETVRVTLKAADAPPAAPSATVPGTPPVRPPTPPTAPPVPSAPPAAGPPRPPAPAPTIALKPAMGAPAGPTPTIRLATSTAPIGAPTIALKTATQPMGGAPGLPKATVQLQAPTQPLGAGVSSSSQLATLQMDDEEDESGVGGFVKVLSIVGFIAACVVLYFQIDAANTWINAADRTESTMKGDWQLLLEPDPNSDS